MIEKDNSADFLKNESELVRAPDCFEIPRHSRLYEIRHSNGCNDNPEVALKSQQIHGRCYVEYGYITEDALMDNGCVVPELDSSRDDGSGRISVNYLLASKTGEGIDNASATMRLIDVGENGTVADLPTLGYFGDKLSQESKTKIDNLVGLYGPNTIREIAALGTLGLKNIRGSYELMRAITQNSLIKAEKYDCREVYLVSLTSVSLGPIIGFAGKNAVEILGEPILVHPNDSRQNDVEITPVLLDPNKALGGFLDEIEEAKSSADIIKLVKKITFLADGLDRSQIDKRVAIFLDKFA